MAKACLGNRTYKLYAVVFALALIAALITASGNSVQGQYISARNDKYYIELKRDGSCILYPSDYHGMEECEYEIDGEDLIVVPHWGSTRVFKIKDDSIYMNGIEFKKK